MIARYSDKLSNIMNQLLVFCQRYAFRTKGKVDLICPLVTDMNVGVFLKEEVFLLVQLLIFFASGSPFKVPSLFL